jgi:hypothetical protein
MVLFRNGEAHMKNKDSNRPAAGAAKPSDSASKATKGAASAGESPTPKPPSKQQLVANLLLRDEGATLSAMIAATGWLPHTTRAALTGLKKKGYSINSDKVDGVRTYRALAPQ